MIPSKPEPTEITVAAQPPVASQPTPLPAVLPEPREGGNYVRDPVTGELSINPAFANLQE